MTMTLTALIFATGFVAVVATLLHSWREHGARVLGLAEQMRGSRAVGQMHFVVRAPEQRSAVTRQAMAVRLPDARLAAG